MTAPIRVLVIDSDEHTAGALVERITQPGHLARHVLPHEDDIAQLLSETKFDAALFDFHLDRPQELFICLTVRRLASHLPILAVVSPGLAMRHVRASQAQHGFPDEVIRKPLQTTAFLRTLQAIVSQSRSAERITRYASLVPEQGRAWADAGASAPTLSEQSIVFTDIRRSTELISTQPLPQWFEAINRSLSDQGALVRQSLGSVVKFTGDGVLASFKGRGRACRALKCAVALQELDRTSSYRGELRISIGLAEGLVMNGLIGEPGRQQYDVIGATVHLAARLCSIAAEGEIIATPRLVHAAGLTGSQPLATRTVQLRGFSRPMECVSFPQLLPRASPCAIPT